MDTEVLRWFQLVADGLTVTEVSRLERTTQSGVSRALARLEREVGAPLLRRSGRVLRMTHAGAVFKQHVDAVVHALDDGLAAVHELLDPETGSVTLAFPPSLGTWLVPDVVGTFRAEHPAVRFDLRPTHDEPAVALRDAADVDLALTTRPAVGSAVRWRRLLTEPLRLAVPVGHALAARPSVHLADAAAEPFVTIRPASNLRHVTEQLWAAADVRPDVAFECEDLPTMHGFVAAGLGVAVMPSPRSPAGVFVTDAVRHLDLVDEGAVREIGLAWTPDRRLLPAAALFRDHVVRRADRLGAAAPSR